MKHKLMTFFLAAVLAAAVVLPASAAPLSAPCVAGAAYNPECDVDHNGVINVLDIQLAAGHWNQSGSYPVDAYWAITGNAGTTPGTNYIGTSDNQALQLRVNGSRALLISPNGNGSHNWIGGYNGNSMSAGVYGGTISGGGGASGFANSVTDNFGTVGGGRQNIAGNSDADPNNQNFPTVGGGSGNVASMSGATVGGGVSNNATAPNATVSGGSVNQASGTNATVGGGFNSTASGLAATVAGGSSNEATGPYSTVGGGSTNTASSGWSTVAGGNSNAATGFESTVGGGANNFANGLDATIPGGISNTASGDVSFAAGYRAKAIHNGAFVWADNQESDFTSSTTDTFNVRAKNGTLIYGDNGNYGVLVDNDGQGDGLRVLASTSQGTSWAAVYASAIGTSPGIHARTNGTYAGYFADQIFVAGGCTGCTLMYAAVNAGDKALQPGDLVAANGVGEALAGTTDPVLRVSQSGADAAGVVGVVYSRVSVTPSERDGEILADVQKADGAVQPGEYLLIVVQGLAQVRLADGEAVTPGQRLKASDVAGQARALRTVEVNGVTLDEGGAVIGVLLDAPDAATGLAPVMVTLR